MQKKLIIYGIGKFAEYAAYVFQKDTDFSVMAFCIEEKFLENQTQFSKPLVEFESIESIYSPNDHYLYIAVGNNQIRKRLFLEAKAKGYTLASYISSKSSYWDNLGAGEHIFIDEGCVLQPFVKIGDNSILFTSNLGHHSKIGDHTLLSGCGAGGNVSIGNGCYVGINTAIKQNINVADNCTIGMGCIIEHNTNPGEVYTHKGTTLRQINSDQIRNRFLK